MMLGREADMFGLLEYVGPACETAETACKEDSRNEYSDSVRPRGALIQ